MVDTAEGNYYNGKKKGVVQPGLLPMEVFE
jgi:hypothetical protein